MCRYATSDFPVCLSRWYMPCVQGDPIKGKPLLKYHSIVCAVNFQRHDVHGGPNK